MGQYERVRKVGRWTLLMPTVALLVAVSGAGASAANGWPTSFVAAATSPTGQSVFGVRANGAVAAFCGHFHGDARREALAKPITGIASSPTGKGYWLAAADGGVFSYGDARFLGSMAGTHLNAPIVGIASTKDGHGYWLAAADGGIFTFGDARFLGSMARARLDQPIVGIMATRSGKGYRLLARDGGVFDFGDATYEGSLGGTGNTDIIGFSPTPSGNGYWILRNNGGRYQNFRYPGPEPQPGYVDGPSVANFGDARKLPGPSFFFVDGVGKPEQDVDFVHNPARAIVPSNPVRQGYVIVRGSGTHFGLAGAPPGC